MLDIYLKNLTNQIMKFSLILCTYGRTEELNNFLNSLIIQTWKNFEIIIVDQNEDNRVKQILKPWFLQFPIIYLRSLRGLSVARNIGLKHAKGDIIGFPDDDCWYFSNTLETVKKYFDEHLKVGVLAGKLVTSTGDKAIKYSPDRQTEISFYNIFKTATSATIFIRSRNIKTSFDENLGIGAKSRWQAGEETDFLLKHLPECKMIFFPNLLVGHPAFENDGNFNFKKIRDYNCGFGRILRIHKYPFYIKMKYIFRSFIGIIIYLILCNMTKVKQQLNAFIGRIDGIFWDIK